MEINGRLAVGCIFLFSAFAFVFFIADGGVATSRYSAIPESTPPHVEIPDGIPTVDYEGEMRVEADETRSRKYESALRVLTSDLSKDVLSVSMADWNVKLGALPVDESSLVLVGKVDAIRAVIPLTKTTVFTVVSISIDRVLKNVTGTTFKAGQRVEAEREGGVVRYPGGQRLWHRVAGQNMPGAGSRYVLFLSNNFPGFGKDENSFYLITGYELRNGQVHLLDSPNVGHPMMIYEGQQEEALMGTLAKLLKPGKGE